jgi:hypothetical protein
MTDGRRADSEFWRNGDEALDKNSRRRNEKNGEKMDCEMFPIFANAFVSFAFPTPVLETKL